MFNEVGPSRERSGCTPLSDTRGRGRMDTEHSDYDTDESLNAGFRTPMQTASNLEGGSEVPSDAQASQGLLISPPATLTESKMNDDVEVPPQTHVSQWENIFRCSANQYLYVVIP